jgi:hypothetical protein
MSFSLFKRVKPSGFVKTGKPKAYSFHSPCLIMNPIKGNYFPFRARLTSTAILTVAPTIGLLPMPRKPIISTCAGTELEPAN